MMTIFLCLFCSAVLVVRAVRDYRRLVVWTDGGLEILEPCFNCGARKPPAAKCGECSSALPEE